jgi:SUMO ligase MMS21 Smc5/6 complex component
MKITVEDLDTLSKAFGKDNEEKITEQITAHVLEEYKQNYKNYMKVVERVIWETEEKLKSYEHHKKILSLSFEQWVQWQNGALSLDDIKLIENKDI